MAIGSTLKAARESAGLSVQAVADQLRMRQTLVRAVEDEDFDQCGGAVYARGHIRSIARIVGIDSEPLISEFDERFGNPSETITELINDGPSLLTPEKKLPWSTIISVAAAALIVIAGASVINGSSSTPVAKPSTSSTPQPDPSESAIAQAPAGQVTFEVAAVKGTSWLSVTNGAGEQLYSAKIFRGTTLAFEDKTRLKVVLGNAGAVVVKVNGKELGTPGGSGQVLHLDFTPAD